MKEPLRNHGDSCRTSTAVASHLRCDGGITVCTICFVRVRAETKTIMSQEKRRVGVYVRKEQTGTRICVTCSTALERTSTFQLNEQYTTHCTVYRLVTTMPRCSIPCVFRLRLDQLRITRQPRSDTAEVCEILQTKNGNSRFTKGNDCLHFVVEYSLLQIKAMIPIWTIT